MKENTIALMDLARNEKDFENMRTDQENIEVFATFVDFLFNSCVHFIGLEAQSI